MGCGVGQLGPVGPGWAPLLFLEEGSRRLSPPPAAVPGEGRDLPAPSVRQGEAEARYMLAVARVCHRGLARSWSGFTTELPCPVERHTGLPRQAARPGLVLQRVDLSLTTQGTSPAAVPGALGRHSSQPRFPGTHAGGILLPTLCWRCGHHRALSQGPTHPMSVSAARAPRDRLGWQPQHPAGSTATHLGWARQSPRRHAGMVPFISQGQRKEEEPHARLAKAVLWPLAGEQGQGQTKQELRRLLAMAVPKPVSPGGPRHRRVPHGSVG